MYYLNIFDTIGKKITELWQDLQNWFMDNYNNPVMWAGIFVVTLAVCMAVYSDLHRGE